jgi:hypothetical protein
VLTRLDRSLFHRRLPLRSGQSSSIRWNISSADLNDDEATSRVHSRSPARSFPHPWPPDGTRALRLEPWASHPAVTRDARQGGNRPPSTDLGYVTITTASLQRNHLTCATSCRTERFIPFLAFPPEVRKIIYTTNSIESLNYQLRKIIKNRGHFPNDDAVIKLLWLAIRDIEDKRARARAKEKGTPRDQRKAPSRLVEGAVVQGWKQALGALTIQYPDRLADQLR